MALDPQTGALWIAGMDGRVLLRVEPSGTLTHLAGTGHYGPSPDSVPAKEATIAVDGLALDAQGRPIFLDLGGGAVRTFNDRVRRLEPSGMITTILDTGLPQKGSEPGPDAVCPKDGPVKGQPFTLQEALAFDRDSNLYLLLACSPGSDVIMVGSPKA